MANFSDITAADLAKLNTIKSAADADASGKIETKNKKGANEVTVFKDLAKAQDIKDDIVEAYLKEDNRVADEKAKADAAEKTKKKTATKYVQHKNKAADGTGQAKNMKSPSGTYRAVNDRNEQVKGITFTTLKNAEENGKSAAMEVMNRVLGTKFHGLSNEAKAKVLAFIIKTNPSVFDSKTGMLKNGADVQKLDVPLFSKIGELTKGETKDKNGAIITNTGYNAKKDSSGKYHYYAPNGSEIKASEFQAHNPTTYAQLNKSAAKAK